MERHFSHFTADGERGGEVKEVSTFWVIVKSEKRKKRKIFP